MNGFRDERDRLLDIYARSKGEERIRILARLVVLDSHTVGKKGADSMRKLSAEEHQRRLELYRMGMNDVEISETLKVPVTTIRGWRHRINLPANKRRRKPLSKQSYKRRKYVTGVPMEWALTADECKVMRRFLADLKKAYALNSNLNVGKYMKMYRYLLNGYHHGRKIVAT